MAKLDGVMVLHSSLVLSLEIRDSQFYPKLDELTRIDKVISAFRS